MAWRRAGDGPLSVRVRPSSLKRDCGQGNEHRWIVPGGRTRALDPGDLCGHSGQKTRARREPARTGRGPSPARCGSACYRTACAELTATVTATAATSGKRQRPVTAHNARTIRANLGYGRP